MRVLFIILITVFVAAIVLPLRPPIKIEEHLSGSEPADPSVPAARVPASFTATSMPPGNTILTGDTRPADLLEYAKTLLGIPYLYASSDPSAGFDCSGFITHVFQHFHIKVPRSSIDFTNEGREVFLEDSRPGDLILFTGTDSTIRQVGHMGIIVDNSEEVIHFIHSSSGKAKGVVITPFENYYKSRFVKVIRVFGSE